MFQCNIFLKLINLLTELDGRCVKCRTAESRLWLRLGTKSTLVKLTERLWFCSG